MHQAVGSSVQRIDVFDKLIGTAAFTADITSWHAARPLTAQRPCPCPHSLCRHACRGAGAWSYRCIVGQ